MWRCVRCSKVCTSRRVQVATAILGALIIWPWVGPPGEEPDLWEHRQRFAWTDDKIEEVREQRTRDSHGRVPHDVRRCPSPLFCSPLADLHVAPVACTRTAARALECCPGAASVLDARSGHARLAHAVQEPVFSMQRCAMLYFWACFVYQYTEVESLEGVGIGDEILGILGADADHPQPAFDALMAMFDLTDYKLFWERTADTKALVAWSKTCVLVAFRGTTTVVNARMDLQVGVRARLCVCLAARP